MVEINSPKIEVIESGLTQEVITLLAIKQRGKATELLVEKIKEDNFIYTTRDDIKTEMWIYNEGVYVPNGKSFIREFCRRILGQVFNNFICNEVISKIQADTYIDSEKFFMINNPYEVPVKNGILNVVTKELIPFDPHKIFFNKLPIKYNPEAICPTIEKHLKEVLKSEDDIKVFYEIVGLLLYKDYFIEKMVMFVGDGRNGKGKTIDLIRRLMGIDNCAGVPLSAIVESSFRVSELFGKMVNIAGDLSNTSLKETGMLKQTTGRDLLGAKRKFLNDIKFINYAKHIFACNDLPKVYDKSKGFWERWVIFEFPYTFIPKSEWDALKQAERADKRILDPKHIDKISHPEELSGLLNKGLEGLKSILENKEFSYSKGSDEIKRFWIRKADSFMSFCMDNLEEDNQGMITKLDMRKAFHNYCKQHSLTGAGDKSISITLQEMYGVNDNRKVHEGFITHVWEGVQFKDKSKNKFVGERFV